MLRSFNWPGVVVACTLVLAAAVSVSAEVVGEIAVEGNDCVSRDRILLAFGLGVGEELLSEDVRDGIRRLYDTGLFSDVRVFAEDLEDGTVRVVIAVTERPTVSSIEIRGNDRVSEEDIRSVLTIESGGPFDASRLEESRVAVLDLYAGRGFPRASVQTETEETSEKTLRVRFDIVEGVRVIVKQILFEGNSVIDDVDLKKVMETKEDRWWRSDAFFDTDVLEEDLAKIEDRYRQDGYIDAKVVGYRTEYDESGEKVTVTIEIDEGSVYTVSGVEWIGASDFAVSALYDLTTVEVGEAYRPGDADETIRRAYNWYGERGYIHATISRAEDVEEGNTVNIRFHVNEDAPARIGRIHIVGNKRTKEKVIRRELTIKPGDLYRTSEVIASQRKVANLGFFNGPTVQFSDSSTPGDIDLVFTVEERQTGRAGVGISHTSEKGITGFLELTEGNLFGNGQYLNLKWEFGKKNTELVLGFTEPWFMDKHVSVGFDMYDTDDKRIYGALPLEFYEDAFADHDDYDEIVNCEDCDRLYVVERERRGGDLRIGWPFMGSRYTTVYAKYTLEQFKRKEYADIETTETTTVDTVETVTTESEQYVRYDPGWEWRSGLTTTVVRRTTDRRFHPRLGSYSRFTADLFGWAFGGDVEYQRYVLDVRKFIPAFWNTTLMLRTRTGVVTGYGDPTTVPEDTRFELGGVGLNGIRGYANRSILPEGSELYGGRTMLLGTAELKLPLTNGADQIPVYGLVFVDAGNTWESAADTHPTQLYWGAGIGVRVEVPVLGNLGVDMGYGFDEEKGGEWVVHYQFGLEY